MLQPCGSPPSGCGPGSLLVGGGASAGTADDLSGAGSSAPCIFCDEVPVRVRPLGRDVFTATLTIRLQPDNTSHPRNLLLELTDESDLFFYHSLVLGEGDFHTLKSEQRLHVDFQALPAQLVELFRRCLLSSGSASSGVSCDANRSDIAAEHAALGASSGYRGGVGGGEAPRMFATLDCGAGGDGLLSIVESNPFRELTHIALRLRQGTDDAVKRHLAGKLRELRVCKADLAERLKTSDDGLSKARVQVDEFSARARVVADERTHLERSLETTHQRELAEIRQEHARTFEDQLRSSAEERAKVEAELKTALAEATARATSAQRQNDTLQQQLQASESLSKQRQERLDSSELLHCDAKQEVKLLRDQTKQLELLKFQHEREIGELGVKHTGLQEQLSSKELLLKNHGVMIDQHGSQKVAMDESLSTCRQQLKMLEEKFALSVQEIQKGNQFIQSLRTETKQAKSKLKLKDAALAQKEKANLELMHEHELSKRVIEEKESEISRGRLQGERQQHDAGELKGKLTEAHEVLKTNQEVIEYLNRQLTERDLKGFPALGGAGYSPASKNVGTLGIDPSRIPQLADFLKGSGGGMKASSSSAVRQEGFGASSFGLGGLLPGDLGPGGTGLPGGTGNSASPGLAAFRHGSTGAGSGIGSFNLAHGGNAITGPSWSASSFAATASSQLPSTFSHPKSLAGISEISGAAASQAPERPGSYLSANSAAASLLRGHGGSPLRLDGPVAYRTPGAETSCVSTATVSSAGPITVK